MLRVCALQPCRPDCEQWKTFLHHWLFQGTAESSPDVRGGASFDDGTFDRGAGGKNDVSSNQSVAGRSKESGMPPPVSPSLESTPNPRQKQCEILKPIRWNSMRGGATHLLGYVEAPDPRLMESFGNLGQKPSKRDKTPARFQALELLCDGNYWKLFFDSMAIGRC